MLQILCICICGQAAWAQNYESLRTRQITPPTEHYSLQRAEVRSAASYIVQPDFPFTSIALNVPPEASLQGAYLLVAQDTFFLREDAHQVAGDSIKQSQLIIFEAPQNTFTFFPAGIRGQVSFSLINAESGRSEVYSRLRERHQKQAQAAPQDACSRPQLIPQSVWRAGLPAPAYQRVETIVRHVIVHHSAGSNTSTDFVNTVRNIYLFHTQDRGWSDIGYNFLIARDGTIFQGRSFGDASPESDDIRGAHFCGQNSGTIGVCMLGNYNTAVPTDTSIASLVRLLSWKLDKENLQPFTTFPHPANNMLGVIAAHRNGCATECPGDNLYVMLDRIRLEVETYLKEVCTPSPPLAFKVYPVPARDELSISLPENREPSSFQLINALGQSLEMTASRQEENWKLDTTGMRAGFYVLRVSGLSFSYERKLLLY
jgi:hypothetical protein